MISHDFKQRLDHWFDGELSHEEEIQLQADLKGVPEAIDVFWDRALLNQMLVTATSTRSVSIDPRVSFSGSSGRQNRLGILGVTAIVLACLVVISILFLPNSIASPTELVQRVLAEFEPMQDRRYSVRIEPEFNRRWNSARRRGILNASTLWVRGDCFVQVYQSDGEELIWGRDSQKSVWFVTGGTSAVIFEAGEVPEVLQEICDLRTLDLGTLLESMLDDFDLKFGNREQGIDRILAQPRVDSQDSKYGRVEIEIETDTLLVRRVTLERLVEGRTVAMVTFLLEEMTIHHDGFYDLASHLEVDAEMFGRGTPRGTRSELLREFIRKLRSSVLNDG